MEIISQPMKLLLLLLLVLILLLLILLLLSGAIILICKKCEYEWETRVENPKSCPRCKSRFDYEEVRKKDD